MATIGMVMMPGSSHLNASLYLAKKLTAAGHRVFYCGVIHDKAFYEKNGLDMELILQRAMPGDYRGLSKGGPLWRVIPEVRRSLAGMFTEIEEDLARVMETRRPDMMILDAMVSFVGLVPLKYDVPTLTLWTSLPFTWDGSIPPPATIMPPPESWWGRLKCSLAWRQMLLMKNVVMQVIGMRRQVRALAARCGVSYSLLDNKDQFSYALRAPGLVACSECFDFARESSHTFHYLGPALDTKRASVDFPWERLVEGKKLVLAFFSNALIVKRGLRRVVDALVKTFMDHPEYQLVLATGPVRYPITAKVAASDVIILPRVPLLQLLERASLMFNHGGLNSVKECIYYGVPVVVFPGTHDQPGTAARVAYHGLGVIGDEKQVSPDYILKLMAGIDDGVRNRVKAMRDQFREDEASASPVSIVESYLIGQSKAEACLAREATA